MNKKPYIIGVAGESGVGKSTIAGIISLFFGAQNTTVTSGDDLHKWERSNPAWGTITHLNPDANNLELGDIHLSELSCGKAIYRSIYNHKTGAFNPPKKIEPKPIIINEGLHAFYSDLSVSLTDLKVFVDTNTTLRTHWKLIRDTEERGYKYNDVLETIEKRRPDAEAIRLKQIEVADVIIAINSKSEIKCLGNKHELVTLEISVIAKNDKVPSDLLEFIRKYMNDFGDFVKASEKCGHSIEMCQDGGGNISVKTSDFMIIKASGFNMKDVHRLNGYSVLPFKELPQQSISSEYELSRYLHTKTCDGYKRPSMETGMHIHLSNKFVLHTHAIYATVLLCLKNSKQIISEIFPNTDFTYIEYTTPGYDLYHRFTQIDKPTSVYLLENHGVVVIGDSVDEALDLLFHINDIARQYMRALLGDEFEEFSISFGHRPIERKHPFPDSVMFLDSPTKVETIAAHNYVNSMGAKLGELRHLTDKEITTLKGLESEKYRQSI